MISVILPTHNGSRTLPRTLASFQRLKHPSSGFELISVDNASSDQTRQILDSYRTTLPLNVLYEPHQGKSFALNLGIRHAKGPLIVFTDDDIIVNTNWLVSYEKAAHDHPEISVFCGQVRHFWEKKPPDWLIRLAEEGRSFAGTPIDLSDGFVPPVYVKGANFMVRRSIIEQTQFCEDPGVNFQGQGLSQGGEDTHFIKHAQSLGYKPYYISGACVEHIVRAEQIGLFPVFQRYVRIGRAITLKNEARDTYTGPRLCGYPRYLFKMIPRDIAKFAWKWFTGRRYEGANDVVDLALLCGRVLEKRRQQRMQSRRT